MTIKLYRDLMGLSKVEEAAGRANGFSGVGLHKKNIPFNPVCNKKLFVITKWAIFQSLYCDESMFLKFYKL